ncbi:MAG: stage V sporulation protein D [Acidobacteriota bacterium]
MRTTNLELRKRIASLFLLFVVIFGGILSIRFFFVQVVNGDKLKRMAEENRMRDIPVKAKRGIIYDRNGHELAISISTDSVYCIPVDVKKTKKEKKVAHILAGILGLDEQQTYKKITRKSGYEWIKRQITPAQSKAIIQAKLPGIGLTDESKRYYPKGTLAAHILGISGVDNTGLEGIDCYYEKVLGGTEGRKVIEHDAVGREIPDATHYFVAPVEGKNLVLTIDETIQYIAERELDKMVQAKKPQAACIIVMDPRTGEVLALANRPTFDPNNFKEYPGRSRRNFAINDAFEPGSTAKIVTASGALEERAVKPEDRYFCPGFVKVGRETIKCAQSAKHGSQSFVEVVENSCNVGFVQTGLKLGMENFYRYLRSFGFGQKTGIDLPGEATGIIVPQKRAKQIDLAVMSFGQANAATPIQLVTAASAVANGGMLMKPHLVREIQDPKGKVIERIAPTRVRQIISKDTSKEMCEILEKVVSEGSGKNAYIEGYRVAGKTGTAQKIAPGGGYKANEYIASFVGFAPADNPRLACIVIIDAPQGYPYFGGWVAAPVFKSVIQDSLRYMEVPLEKFPKKDVKAQNEENKKVLVPDLVNLGPQDASIALRKAGLNMQLEGEGEIVWSQVPKAYTEVSELSRVIVYLSPVPDQQGTGQVTIPDLSGKSLKEAARSLSRLGLHLRPEGYGLAYKQKPAPGTKVSVGSSVTVEFQPLE